MSNQNKLNDLRRRIGEIKDISASLSVLHWDQEVFMPPKAAAGRGQQLSTLSSIAHRMATDDELGALLEDLDQAGLEGDDATLVSETLHDYKREKKLPESFVREFSLLQSQAYEAWVKARKDSNFPTFQPLLEKVVDKLKQRADLMGYEGSPYNALLEDYERGMTAEALKPIFADLAQRQSAIVERIANAPSQPDVKWLDQTWDADKQWDVSMQVIRDLGYDLDAGRMDKSVHPFTTDFGQRDVRITTRVSDEEPFSCLTGAIHEAGHALYEQGFRDEDERTTLAEAISLGIHESQSRMWENLIGRSLPFWKRYAPLMQRAFPNELKGICAEQMCAAINQVQPTFIRVEADECTYNLHVVLRFELELDLIEGRLAVKDIPDAWNAKIKDYLGLDVTDDAMGCLQDIHWSHGSMGYFPTYALGNLYASQMFETIEKDIPDLWSHVEQGEFAPLLTWLRENVHRVGRRMTAPQLIKHITGDDLSSEPFIRYLNKKFAGLYGVEFD
ncbi:MAG: carboxypeptidase M32 [Candidatus Hinthialibacter antarcticus]|nr:carboxypeptidase M32 [Candidatus Hinthialibacter antarcticus]